MLQAKQAVDVAAQVCRLTAAQASHVEALQLEARNAQMGNEGLRKQLEQAQRDTSQAKRKLATVICYHIFE